jgi:calcineurin-like phosphoesterase family protein
MTLWFTADPHFGHYNIIRHCNRPFTSAQEMDDTILANWNAVLLPGDRLFVVGDFCGQRRKAPVIQSYLRRIHLNPRNIWLILGNHDDENESRKVFPNCKDLYTVKVRLSNGGFNKNIVLCHYAMRTWEGSGRRAWHLYGHSHGSLPDDPFSLSFDCGVDAHDFHLLSPSDVAGRMANKHFSPVDHHGSDDEGPEEPT